MSKFESIQKRLSVVEKTDKHYEHFGSFDDESFGDENFESLDDGSSHRQNFHHPIPQRRKIIM